MSKEPKEKEKLSQQELLWKIYESTERTRKYIMWGRVMSVIKILIVVIPIVLAIIYLPPYIEKLLSPYEELMQGAQNKTDLLKDIDLKNLDLNQLLNQSK